MTLTEFLLARIAEDEAVAKAAAKYSSKWSAVDEFHETVLLHPDDTMGHTFDSAYGQIAPHIARHDPARVLAECEAKRRIVELHKAGGYLGDSLDECAVCADGVAEFYGSFTQVGLTWPCPTLRAVALPYAADPDYDEAWRL